MTLTDDLEWERACANSSAHPQVRAQLLDDALGHALTALNETERALNEHQKPADEDENSDRGDETERRG